MQFTNVGNGELEKLCPKDGSARYAPHNIWFDAKGGHLAVTDGHALAVAHVHVDAGDITGWIPPAALTHYRKLILANPYAPGCARLQATKELVIVTDVAAGTKTEYQRPTEKQCGKFPNFAAVLPKVEGPPAFAISLGLLTKLVAALGRPNTYDSKSSDMVAIWAPSPTSAMLVKTSEEGALGVLMPMRTDEKRWLLSLDAIDTAIDEARKPKSKKKAAVVPMTPAAGEEESKPDDLQHAPPAA